MAQGQNNGQPSEKRTLKQGSAILASLPLHQLRKVIFY